MAQAGHALKIEFFPTRVEQIPIPPGYSFVVCHSMVEAPKTLSARRAYNVRAAESRLAAALLGKALSRKMQNRMVAIERLGDLYSTDLHLSEAEIDFLLQETFLKDNYTLGEIAYMLGASEDFVCRKYLSAFSPEEARTLDRLKLRSRSRHVLSEGRRVRQAAEALRVSEMNEFGKLMYESHESCATDYEVSIPELDALVAIARESGALGSRLTGAGFGGCTISLVENALVEGFVRLLERSHSRGGDRTEKGNLTFDDRIFVAKPMPAAMVLR